jgi:cbb3-type cytochrome oxidase cytochrome c subunit
MKNGFNVFLAAFVALGLSWCGFVLGPAKQLGTARQAAVLNSSDIYPLQRTGDAKLGLQVYRANGCAACHTEQVRQDGVACELVLTDAGKNTARVVRAIQSFVPYPEANSSQKQVFGGIEQYDLTKLPQTILKNLTKDQADAIADQITAAGGKSETQIVSVGVDIKRGWGIRRSVAADYLCDCPVQLGSLRAGPDLANVGARFPDLNWELVHLYAPQTLVKNSAMPPFRFLFEVRKIADAPSPDALKFPQGFAPFAGFEVVPTAEAKQLAAYLLSLKADAPLYEAPFTPVMTKP